MNYNARKSPATPEKTQESARVVLPDTVGLAKGALVTGNG